MSTLAGVVASVLFAHTHQAGALAHDYRALVLAITACGACLATAALLLRRARAPRSRSQLVGNRYDLLAHPAHAEHARNLLTAMTATRTDTAVEDTPVDDATGS